MALPGTLCGCCVKNGSAVECRHSERMIRAVKPSVLTSQLQLCQSRLSCETRITQLNLTGFHSLLHSRHSMARFLTHIAFRESRFQELGHPTTCQISIGAEQDEVHQHGTWVLKHAEHLGGRNVQWPFRIAREMTA